MVRGRLEVGIVTPDAMNPGVAIRVLQGIMAAVDGQLIGVPTGFQRPG